MNFGKHSLSKNDDKLEEMSPALTISTLAQLKQNLKNRMHRMGVYQMASFSEKWTMAAYRESSRRDLRVKKKLKSLKKKRHGGICDRKPFRITKLILSRKG